MELTVIKVIIWFLHQIKKKLETIFLRGCNFRTHREFLELLLFKSRNPKEPMITHPGKNVCNSKGPKAIWGMMSPNYNPTDTGKSAKYHWEKNTSPFQNGGDLHSSLISGFSKEFPPELGMFKDKIDDNEDC